MTVSRSRPRLVETTVTTSRAACELYQYGRDELARVPPREKVDAECEDLVEDAALNRRNDAGPNLSKRHRLAVEGEALHHGQSKNRKAEQPHDTQLVPNEHIIDDMAHYESQTGGRSGGRNHAYDHDGVAQEVSVKHLRKEAADEDDGTVRVGEDLGDEPAAEFDHGNPRKNGTAEATAGTQEAVSPDAPDSHDLSPGVVVVRAEKRMVMAMILYAACGRVKMAARSGESARP